MRRTSKKAPYLGKNKLRWCPKDNIPILKKMICPNCGTETFKVSLTPPGDVKPAFEKEIDRIKKIVDKDYGLNLGNFLFPPNKIYLINKIPALDYSVEIIADGKIYGVFMFDPIKHNYFFKPKIEAGKKLIEISEEKQISLKKVIQISNDSLPFILNGKSILAPGVIGFSKDIQKGDYCIVKNNHDYVTIAISHSNSNKIKQMVEEGYGKIGKNRKKNINKSFYSTEINTETKLIPSLDNDVNWNFVYSANNQYIKNIVEEAKNFIRKTTTNQGKGKQIAVAYSGGKDSLATLLLVFEILGPNFHIFFADTGLEFPEILKNTKKITKILKMHDKLRIKSAHMKFWELLENFGPPARDYRFCCHALKAQQIINIITELAEGKKVLTFLGQRRYESFSRSNEKRIYVNSFIPLQIAATPIKEWNALEVWLFILYYPHFVKEKKIKIPVTPLYFEGFHRIGCYLCPATSLSSFDLIRETRPGLLDKWDKWLDNYSKKNGYPDEWIKFGLWRFKKINAYWRDTLKKLDFNYDLSIFDRNDPIRVAITKGFSPCLLQGGYSLKGKVNTALDLSLIDNILPIIKGQKEIFNEIGVVTIQSDDYNINIFTDGSFFIRVRDKKYPFEKLKRDVIGIIVKSHRCNNCGVCENICPEKIIKIEINKENNISYPKIHKDSINKCLNCAKCITHCPIYQKIKD